jgi:hypothetical protein
MVRAWRTSSRGRLAWANTRSGIVPTDSVWRDATRAATTQHRSTTVVVLADVVTCFVNVEWRGLEVAAISAGYPSGLHLSVVAYASPRRLLVGRVVALPLFPTRGIGPGSAFATDELLLFLSAHIQGWASLHPGVGISVHVDDPAVSVSRMSPRRGGCRHRQGFRHGRRGFRRSQAAARAAQAAACRFACVSPQAAAAGLGTLVWGALRSRGASWGRLRGGRGHAAPTRQG